MNYLSNKLGFLGVDNKFNFKEKAVVIPFGLEKTVSYGGGTKNGPKEIIKASHQVELYDEELNCEPYKKIGIKTLKPFKINKNIKIALKKISDIKIHRGSNRNGIIAACVREACMLQGSPRSTKEIADIFKIKITHMTRGCKKFQEIMNLSICDNENYI